MSIQVLGDAVIGRIAAGEVVERPASAAKELIENALDAGATAITVELKEGGIAYLRVTDNGSGIAAGEVRLAFLNHATSKLRNESDLMDIRTLGFRGEALPSIAAVSKVTMSTRQRGSDIGARVVVEAGQILSISEAGCPEGTTVAVENLFFNVPARRAFLKKPQVEAGYVSDMVSKLILANPQVSLRLVSGGKTLYHSPGDGDIRHAAMSVYGRQVAADMMEIDAREGGLGLKGLIGVGKCARPNRSRQVFSINGRVVSCPALTQALEIACREHVMIGQFPMCALSVSMPPHSVDINVHPNKLEVRLRDEDGFRISAEALIRRAFGPARVFTVPKEPQPISDRPELAQRAPEPAPQKETPEPSAAPQGAVPAQDAPKAPLPTSLPYVKGGTRLSERPFMPPMHPRETGANPPAEERTAAPAAAEQQRISDTLPVGAEKELPQVRVLGVAFQTYIVAELDDVLLLIDQHAAHERILFEKMQAIARQNESAAQQLLTPIVLTLSYKERALALEQQEALAEIGFEIEPFGERDIQVRSVPHMLGRPELNLFFAELLDKASMLRSANEENRRNILAQTACKHAIKAGDVLSRREIDGLIELMQETGAPPTCPHGRPVIEVIRRSELERRFRRVL